MPIPQPYGVTSPIAPMPPTTPSSTKVTSNELDLNDPSTLEIYSRILLFKDDHMRDELAFSRTLSPKQRRVVHLVAQKLGVYHYSVGEGEERYAVVTRIDPERVSHPMQAEPRRVCPFPCFNEKMESLCLKDFVSRAFCIYDTVNTPGVR